MTIQYPKFSVSPDIFSLGVRGIYLAISGMENKLSDPQFEIYVDRVFSEMKETLTVESIQQDAVLRGFRELHDKVGLSNKKNVASPENLLAMMLEKGRLPRVNLMVDIYNLVSIKIFMRYLFT